MRLALLLPALLLTAPAPTDPAAPRPNIVLIVADDLGYADMSFLETVPDDVSTPALDRLAATGTYFTDAYSTAPICSPSRAGLVTGRYQQRWGNYWYGQGGLPAGEATLPQLLRELGYVTKKIGKTHLNGGEAEHPLDHGFDEFFGFIGHTKDYVRLSEKDVAAYGAKNAKAAHIGPLERGRGKMESFEGKYATHLFTDEAVEYVTRDHGGKPFFLHLAFNAVHHPTYVGHPPTLAKYGLRQFPFWDPAKEPYMTWHRKWGHLGAVDPDGRKRYLATLEIMDDGVRGILDALRGNGLQEETIVVFLSDNGGTINTYSDNTPLRGYKYMFGEGGIRIPVIAAWPGRWPAGKRSGALVSAMDLVPTLLAAAGGDVPGNLDGRDLGPLIRGESKAGHDALVWADGKGAWVVRKGAWKLVQSKGWTHANFEIVDGVCKSAPEVVYPEGKRLFLLATDIGEETDVSREHPEVVRELEGIYRAWRAEMGEPRRAKRR